MLPRLLFYQHNKKSLTFNIFIIQVSVHFRCFLYSICSWKLKLISNFMILFRHTKAQVWSEFKSLLTQMHFFFPIFNYNSNLSITL